jgi:hypothetical protein
MQLQLQAAGDSTMAVEWQQGQPAAAHQLQLHTEPAFASPQQQKQLVAVDEQQGALAPAEAESPSPAAAAALAAEAAELRDALASTEEHVAVLTQENERLMDLSNGLRAENEGLKRALTTQVGT